MIELSHTLEQAETGVKHFYKEEAIVEAVRYWINIPEGRLPGRPGWGHPFLKFVFSANNSDGLIFLIEMQTLSAFERDFPYFKLKSISVEPGTETILKLGVMAGDKIVLIEENI